MGPVSITIVAMYVCCGVLPLLLVPHLLSYRQKPGAIGLLGTIFGLALWALSTGAMHVTVGYWSRLVAMSVFFAGTAFGGIGYFALAAEYGGVLEVSWRKFAPFSLPYFAILALAWTDRYHGLVWGGAVPGNAGLASPGPGFFAYVLFIVAVAAAGFVLISREVIVDGGIRRLQGIVLLGAGLPPLVLGALSAFVFSDFSYPLAPLSLVASVFFYAWALFRVDFLEVGLVGRHRMVEALDDGIVTLDAEDRVADANPAAHRIAGIEAGETGLSVREFFADVPEVRAELEGSGSVDTELTVSADGTERHYHLDASPIRRGSRPAGRLIVIRDITPVKRRERALAEREGELDLLRQVLSRVLRHNIRNDLSVIRGYAELVATNPDADHEALAASIVRRCDDLAEMSEKAATIERLVAEGDSAERTQLGSLLASIVEQYRSRYPGVDFELDLLDGDDVEVDTSLAFAFENLIENAAEHSSASPPSQARADAAEHSSASPRSSPRDDAAERSSASARSLTREGATEHSSTRPPSYPGEDARDDSSASPRSRTRVDAAEHPSATSRSDAHGDGPERPSVSDRPFTRGDSSDSLFTPPDTDPDEGAESTVHVAARNEDRETVVTVADDGPGIPDHELEVLKRGEETPLEHGSGIGLWIIYWIGEHTDVSISFDTGDDGTTVTVAIPQ